MAKFVTTVGGLAIIALIGISFLARHSSNTTGVSEMRTGDAAYQLDKTAADLGSMSVDDTKSADYTFTNTSNDSIQLSNFQTSCDCTSALVKIGSTVSPEFSMGGMMSSLATNWQSDLPAGQTATITVTYQPSKMPVYGAVSRTLKFMANGKEITLTVNANVR